MMHLNHYIDGHPVPFIVNGNEEYGLDDFAYNGEVFHSDDIVVVDGQIGNIERVNTVAGYCALGFSMDFLPVMNRKPHGWESGHRSKLDGIRHATEEEILLYDMDANGVFCGIEEADRQRKDRFIY